MNKKPHLRRYYVPRKYTIPKTSSNQNIPAAFVLSEKKQIGLLTFMFCGAVIFTVAGIAVSQQKTPAKKQSVQSVSTLAIDPSPTVEPTVSFEPVITSWRNFSNDIYNFSTEVPAEWNAQDYNNGTLIAFSPDELPCRTCTYFRNGYISIRIFNQKTEPEFYAAFQLRINSLGKNKEYLPIKIDKKTGVYFSNVAAVENQGWVYEISFDKESTVKAEESPIFQKVLSSFKFTGLVFDN